MFRKSFLGKRNRRRQPFSKRGSPTAIRRRRLFCQALEQRHLLAAPSVLSVTPNLAMVADANAGSQTFSVAVVFDQSMDTLPTPTLTFAPDVAGGGRATVRG